MYQITFNYSHYTCSFWIIYIPLVKKGNAWIYIELFMLNQLLDYLPNTKMEFII